MQIKIEIKEKELPEHTLAEIMEWIKYHLGHYASISLDNPLIDFPFEPQILDVLQF